MAKLGRGPAKERGQPSSARRAQTREVFLLDELGRFVAGSTAEGLPLMEGVVPKKTLELARAVVAGREVPPGTFVGKVEGDHSVLVYGGDEFFGCAAQGGTSAREVPHELAAAVEAFEKAAESHIEAGSLSRAAIDAFPKIAAAALKEPARFAAVPVGPLAFARTKFRTSGARLALDVEVINDTPWVASRVQVRLRHDARALPLVSVKARSGGYSRGVLTLPPVQPRSRDRAVILFEPRQAGVHSVEGELVLGLDGEGERRAKIRRARTAVSKARVVPTVPKTLRDFHGLIVGKLQHSAALELSEVLGGRATVAGLGTEIEKDAFAKVLDWHGAGGAREVWYLGLGGGPDRPILVQLEQAPGGAAEVVVAAAKRADVLSYTAQLRARLDLAYAGAPVADRDVVADEAPEERPTVLRAAIVARQISADIDSGELDSTISRKAPAPARAVSAHFAPGGGKSAGDELVPGLIDALERSLAGERRRKA